MNVTSLIPRGSFSPVALGLLIAAVSPAHTGEPFNPMAGGVLPQYIFFNKSPTARDQLAWRQSDPASFTVESMREVVDTLGARGGPRLRVGVHFPFSILEGDVATLARSLRSLLAAAEAADVPVLITLDGQNWWESRSDLWNWWDPTLPGYDPKNRHNVEWFDWGPEHAVKVSWRNWGRQLRVRPAPNIASPRFLEEHWKRYDVLVPIIAEWYRALPADRKYLFGGVKVGWEASINVNAFYYSGGNQLFDQHPNDSSRDPHGRDKSQGWTFGAAPLGYAAAFTAGIKRGGELTKHDIEQLVHAYLSACSEQVRRRGVPSYMIFTHQGGTYPPWEKHLSFKPAINHDSIPGWSFYTHDPPDCGSLEADLTAVDRRQWSASEWWLGATGRRGWRKRFDRTLRFQQCRVITVYNWERFRAIPEALAAVRELIEQ